MARSAKKPYLSPSQIGTYFRCAAQYEFRYIENLVIPPGIAMLKGRGLDGGASTNMEQKIDSHEDLPESDIVDAAVSEFDTGVAGGYELDDEDSDRGATVVVGEARDGVADMAKVHAREQAPEYQPLLVQERVRLKLAGERDLLGYLDMADDQRRVVDWKTSARRKSQSEADESIQLTAYSAMHKARTGESASALRLDCVIQTKTRTERQLLETGRDAKSFDALAAIINVVSDSIAAGSFAPNGLGTWICSPKWCGYYSRCKYPIKGSPTFVDLKSMLQKSIEKEQKKSVFKRESNG